MNRIVKTLVWLALLGTLVIAVPAFGKPGPLEEAQLVLLSFDAAPAGEGVWNGSISGDMTGSLRTEVTGVRSAGPLRFVDVHWIVNAAERSFVAEAEGTMNTLTGTTVVTGEVVEGSRTGAIMYGHSQTIDPASGRLAGTILLVDWVEIQ